MKNWVGSHDDLVDVYVYPDGENHETPPSWKSDDYRIRRTTLCVQCNEMLDICYDEPFANCGCGITQEWYL